jgi:hypothetical protein
MSLFSQLNSLLSKAMKVRWEMDEAEGVHPGFTFSQLNTFDFFPNRTLKTNPLRRGAFSQLNALYRLISSPRCPSKGARFEPAQGRRGLRNSKRRTYLYKNAPNLALRGVRCIWDQEFGDLA